MSVCFDLSESLDCAKLFRELLQRVACSSRMHIDCCNSYTNYHRYLLHFDIYSKDLYLERIYGIITQDIYDSFQHAFLEYSLSKKNVYLYYTQTNSIKNDTYIVKNIFTDSDSLNRESIVRQPSGKKRMYSDEV